MQGGQKEDKEIIFEEDSQAVTMTDIYSQKQTKISAWPILLYICSVQNKIIVLCNVKHFQAESLNRVLEKE